MRKVKTLANYLSHATSSKLLILSAVVVISGILIINNAIGNPKAASASLPRDKDNNAIIYGGAVTQDEFVQKYKENKTKDLPKIYERFGLSSNELDRFKSTAKLGYVYKNGDIKVDGEKVAYDSKSLGRKNMTGSEKLTIGGDIFYLRPTSVSFAAESIAAFVMYTPDKKQIETVIITSCGNPVTAKQPSYQCDMLNKKQISEDTYQFDTKVSYKDGAKITKVVYEFGDGQKLEKTNPSDKVTHKYSKPGNYTAKVTAYFDVFGKTKTSTSKECSAPVKTTERTTPPKPVYACESLSMKKISRTKFEFTATTSASGGATLKNADFDFGDGQSAKGVSPKTSNTIVTDHNYQKDGDYTVVATVHFNVASGVKSDDCQVSITVDEKPPVVVPPAEAPPVPETPPTTPEVIPSTGPAEIVGSVIGLGGLVSAGSYYLRSRRGLLNTFRK